MAIGVGVSGVGGDIMFIEASRMPGKGSLTVTGQLGDVMKESATAAMSFVRSRASDLGIDQDFFKESDVHLHVPAGAIPKDGPSAGTAMTIALVSLLTGVPVRDDVAMTGEITLRGQVLPVGGIKMKALAARRAGVDTFVLPKRNEADLDDLPEELREEMTFVLAETLDDVLAAAMPQAFPRHASRHRGLRRVCRASFRGARTRRRDCLRIFGTADDEKTGPANAGLLFRPAELCLRSEELTLRRRLDQTSKGPEMGIVPLEHELGVPLHAKNLGLAAHDHGFNQSIGRVGAGIRSGARSRIAW